MVQKLLYITFNYLFKSEWKPYMANIVCKSWSKERIVTEIVDLVRQINLSNQAAPDQMIIPLNKLPC